MMMIIPVNYPSLFLLTTDKIIKWATNKQPKQTSFSQICFYCVFQNCKILKYSVKFIYCSHGFEKEKPTNYRL